jgi:hypothetical protein
VGVQAALLSWIVVLVPAIAAFTSTSGLNYNAGVSWADAGRVGSDIWVLGHGGWTLLGAGQARAVVSLTPLGIALISLLACWALTHTTTARGWGLVGGGLLGFLAVDALIAFVLAGEASRSGWAALAGGGAVAALGLVWGNSPRNAELFRRRPARAGAPARRAATASGAGLERGGGSGGVRALGGTGGARALGGSGGARGAGGPGGGRGSALAAGGVVALGAGTADRSGPDGPTPGASAGGPRRWLGRLRQDVPAVGRAAGGAAGLVLAEAAGLVAVAAVGGQARLRDLFESLGADPVGGIALALLGLALVPNALALGVAYLAGAGFEVGEGTWFSPLATEGGMEPVLPILGLLPTTAPPPGLAALAIAPVLAGCAVGWATWRRLAGPAPARPLAAAGAAALSAGGAAALSDADLSRALGAGPARALGVGSARALGADPSRALGAGPARSLTGGAPSRGPSTAGAGRRAAGGGRLSAGGAATLSDAVPRAWWRPGVVALVGGIVAAVALTALVVAAGGALGPGRLQQVGAPWWPLMGWLALELGAGGALGALVLPRPWRLRPPGAAGRGFGSGAGGDSARPGAQEAKEA